MYYLSVNALARALKENRIDSWGKAKYLMANIIVFSLAGVSNRSLFLKMNESPKMTPLSTFPLFTILDIFLVVLINAYGIYLCYQANQQGDQKDFIDRFICLYFPISLEIAVTLFVVSYFLALGVGGYLLAGNAVSPDVLFIISWTINPIALIIKYLWIRKKIIFISQK